MTDDADAIDDIAESMGSAPKCYDHGAVDAWNDKVSQMNALCLDFNVQQTALSAACQTSNTPMGCEQYQKGTKQGGMIISKCQKPNKWIMWLIAMLIFFILLAIAVFMGPLIAFFAALAIYLAYSMLGIGDMLAGALNYQSKEMMEDDAKAGFNPSEQEGKK